MANASTPLPPDNNRGPEILAVCGTMVGLAVAMVLLRVWVRARLTRSFGWDDSCIVVAATVIFVELMIIIPQVHLGAGRHSQYIVPPSNITKCLKFNFVSQCLCVIVSCLAKVSIGLFLQRLTPSPRYRQVIIGANVITVLSSAGAFFTILLQCRPLAYTWDPMGNPGGSCLPAPNLKFALFFNSALSVFTDLLFALLPIPMLWKVQLNWKVKATVSGILCLGIFATVAGFVKFPYLNNFGNRGDFTFDTSDLLIWTTVENCVAVIAACCPCLKPLFKTILGGSSAAKYGSRMAVGYMRNADAASGRYNIKARDRASGSGIEMYGRSRNSTPNVATPDGGFRTKMDSEESILPPPGLPFDGVTRTVQVSVSVDENTQKKPKSLV